MTQVLLMVMAVMAFLALAAAGGTLVATWLVAGEVRRFLQAPAFYARKLLGPPAPDRQARAIARHIEAKLAELPRGSFGEDVRSRVEAALPVIAAMVESRDKIGLHLEYRTRDERSDRDAVARLERRRSELDGRLEAALTQLRRIEDRLAEQVYTAGDQVGEAAMHEELAETLEELAILGEASRSPELLGEP